MSMVIEGAVVGGDDEDEPASHSADASPQVSPRLARKGIGRVATRSPPHIDELKDIISQCMLYAVRNAVYA